MRGGQIIAGAGLLLLAAFPAAAQVEFTRDIRPILSDKCYTCHGPDEANRQTKLRFDIEAAAKADLGGRFAIVAGDAAKSELIRRITAENAAVRMPPAYSGQKLTDREIGLLREWIEQGARWQAHWSLIPPRRLAPPRVRDQAWLKNEIDAFVLARLEREGLGPSPEAPRETLLRRVTLDLTGLPPTPAEIDAFLKDNTPGAYEKAVDRLLRSPRYGERMAIRWLDAARYADTNGYQTDAERYMWRWRDWVIEAFNRNLPFDRFTIEQIAGDLLPNPTLEQRLATGFNRNHRGNGEGGIIPEEYAVEYVVDRVETTSTVWLGLTMGCARCHDHKYDPITQKDFYRVYAYFNNIPEPGRYNKYGNTVPLIKAPTREQEAKLAALDQKLAEAEQRFARLEPEARRAQEAWERRGVPGLAEWTVMQDLAAQFPLDDGGGGEPAEGRIGGAARLDGQRFVNGGNVGNFGFYEKFTLAAWIYPEAPTGAIVTRTTDIAEETGYGLYLKDGKVQVNLVQRWLDDALRLETARPVELNRWSHVMMTYDGSRTAAGVKIYVDGAEQEWKILLDELNQPFRSREPLRIGGGGGPENRFRGRIDEVRVYTAVLTAEEAGILAESTPAVKRRRYFLEEAAPQEIREAWRQLTAARREREQFFESIPTAMVMQEREQPRDTHVLIRGAYDRPGEKVGRGVPAVLPPLPNGAPNNRLGFARWLVDRANPLTARVMVNRFWQMYFGAGLVRTVEDFGSQGEWPTHPELLDWLATEFMESGWDVKALQKKIVMSATYRQASKAPAETVQRDPENRLLARAPRFRLPAEMVRDQALAMSGLLVEKLGGPSVKPYQPAGLWKELSGGEDYVQDRGENLYRRSLYTYWKRAAPPPAMMAFDAAGREACTVRESRTNTPLQALDLMNDVTYVEAARVLAERMMLEGGATPEERTAFAFRLATARQPRPEESEVLVGNFRYFLDNYRTRPEAAVQLISQGESPHNADLDAGELAAYTAVASLILNLDETVTRE
jgi:hypothetical protein